ncbi:hypothetical protein Tco_1545057, partial [Tanacetum coccineum]
MELRRNLKISDEKLSAALAEINAKDEIAKKQTKIGREAIQARTRKGYAASLKECMLQLRFVRKEQEKKIHDAVTKTSTECEKQ